MEFLGNLLRFLDKYPLFIWVLIIGTAVVYVAIREFIGYQKGKDGVDKANILTILKGIIPAGVDYVPVYAYWRVDTGRYSTDTWFYAIGMAQNQMYVANLNFSNKKMECKNYFILRKEDIGRIGFGDLTGKKRDIYIYNRNQSPLLNLYVEEINTHTDKTYPVNIHQKEEKQAFMQRITEWKEWHDSKLGFYN